MSSESSWCESSEFESGPVPVKLAFVDRKTPKPLRVEEPISKMMTTTNRKSAANSRVFGRCCSADERPFERKSPSPTLDPIEVKVILEVLPLDMRSLSLGQQSPKPSRPSLQLLPAEQEIHSDKAQPAAQVIKNEVTPLKRSKIRPAASAPPTPRKAAKGVAKGGKVTKFNRHRSAARRRLFSTPMEVDCDIEPAAQLYWAQFNILKDIGGIESTGSSFSEDSEMPWVSSSTELSRAASVEPHSTPMEVDSDDSELYDKLLALEKRLSFRGQVDLLQSIEIRP